MQGSEGEEEDLLISVRGDEEKEEDNMLPTAGGACRKGISSLCGQWGRMLLASVNVYGEMLPALN